MSRKKLIRVLFLIILFFTSLLLQRENKKNVIQALIWLFDLVKKILLAIFAE